MSEFEADNMRNGILYDEKISHSFRAAQHITETEIEDNNGLRII